MIRRRLAARRASALAAALAAAWLTGCATAGGGAASPETEMAELVRSRGLDPGRVIVPFALDSEMRAWAHAAVPAVGEPEVRLRLLLGALIGAGGHGIAYASGYTPTAVEAFASRKANCLGFTHLFVGMAREIGLSAYFLGVDDVERYQKDGDLVVISDHITAGFGPPSQVQILEFTLGQPIDYRHLVRVSDLTAVAMFYSNRGAELLRAGEGGEALTWLDTAVRLDPGLAQGWVNLGVARRRAGDLPGADAAYQRALEADPTSLSAYQNRASLLRLRGQADEALALLALTERLGSRNPYNYLNLGDWSLARGRIEEARRYYRKAVGLGGDSAEAHAAMGLCELAAGRAREARRWLRKAEKLDASDPRTRQLHNRLEGPPAERR